MTDLVVNKAEVTCDLFDMLIQELHSVQDEVKKMRESVTDLRSNLERRSLPELENITPDNLESFRIEQSDHDIVRMLGCRTHDAELVILPGGIVSKHVSIMKRNGFRLYEAASRWSENRTTTVALWGDRVLDEMALTHVWHSPADFVEL